MITVLKSKIHAARITEVNPEYEGSLGIDMNLMECANIRPYEQIQLLNCNNGARLTTYAIPLAAGSCDIQVNGAAAHHAQTGDKVIIVSYQLFDPAVKNEFQTTKIICDAHNHVTQTIKEQHR